MSKKEKKNKEKSTEQFVNIQEIRGPLVIVRDGSLRVVVLAHATNFEFKSEDEKIGILSGFKDFLDSVDFPIQIVMQSRKLNIEPYIKNIEATFATIDNELLRVQASEYARFVKGLTELQTIVSKRFYIIIPYYLSESSVGKTGIKERLKDLFIAKKHTKELSDQELDKYVTQLDQRIAVVRMGIERIGVRTDILDRDELIDLFYKYYNPHHIGVQDTSNITI